MSHTLEPGIYYGHTRSLHSEHGLRIAETAFEEDLVIPRHEHRNPFFCLVLAGQGSRSWPGRAGWEAPMGLTLFPAELPHANAWQGAGGRALHVELAPQWFERLGVTAEVLKRPGDYGAGLPLALARRLALECQHPDAVTGLAAEGLVLELMAACARTELKPCQSAGARRWMAPVREQLHERFAAPPSLAELAEVVHVSPDHLARCFREHHGCTIGEFVRRLRIEHACRLLHAGSVALAQIAQETGFVDQSHFTRSFKAATGLTPAAYRRGARPDAKA